MDVSGFASCPEADFDVIGAESSQPATVILVSCLVAFYSDLKVTK